jgi:D-3-phosphoglycerate dehydrogenase
MATLIFDLDSTIATCESLVEIFRIKGLNEKQLAEMRKITDLAMAGKIPFNESLENKLAVMPIYRKDVIDFGESIGNQYTPKMDNLIKHLIKKGHQIWIISGAPREIVIGAGKYVGLPSNRCLGVVLKWSNDGKYEGVDYSQAMSRSKWEAAQEVKKEWGHPSIAIGDAMTDYEIFERGIVDKFILFTEIKRREAVLEKKVVEAKNVEELQNQLNKMIYG